MIHLGHEKNPGPMVSLLDRGIEDDILNIIQ